MRPADEEWSGSSCWQTRSTGLILELKATDEAKAMGFGLQLYFLKTL